MGTELLVVDQTTYPILADSGNVGQTILDNMGGEAISPADLVRIKIPSSGATTWLVPTADGEQPMKTLDGVIVHICRRRAMWDGADPTGKPPLCCSNDMIRGVGNPGGECEHCKWNQYGTSVKQDGSPANGKKCKETKLVFLLRPGQFLPDVVGISPGSLKDFRKWQLSLKVPYWAISVSLSLKEDRNTDGIKYAKVVPTQTSILNKDVAEVIAAYAKQMAGVFEATSMTPEETGGSVEI